MRAAARRCSARVPASPQCTLRVVHRFSVEDSDAGARLDHFASARLPAYSRSRIRSWIDEGRVRVNSAVKKASWKLRAGEVVEVEPAELKPLRAFAEDIPLEILYEDADVVAVNKPAGLVVHAGAGRDSGTLVNALLHHFEALSGVGGEVRPGIVHRLDKGTSGVLLVARTDEAHRNLAAQFAGRTVKKVYLALVEGEVKRDKGVVEHAIARDPVKRTRMTARLAHGREAYTEYKVVERYERFTLLEVRIGTGRTHQIRVHLSSLHHPVAGDTLYGAARQPELERPWLHAWRITFEPPSGGEAITVEAPVPEELVLWKQRLRQHL
ncbi:MAG: RluA family pseudouridine synthase [Acidobacteria bacterium]|nr:RluA family pseudouridine synthase [Acidobacteriota bacterium]